MANISDWSIQQIVDKAPNVERAWVNDATPPGMFDYVSGDSTSTSDGKNVLVSTSGKRWHRVGEIPHITIAALRLINSRFNMCYITDAGKEGIFKLNASEALSDDGEVVIEDLAGNKFSKVIEKVVITDGPAQASYVTQGEDIIRVTSVALKSIIISDVDIAGAYTKKTLTVIDEVGNAGTTPIVITGESGQLINGSASLSISVNGGQSTFYSDGTGLITTSFTPDNQEALDNIIDSGNIGHYLSGTTEYVPIHMTLSELRAYTGNATRCVVHYNGTAGIAVRDNTIVSDNTGTKWIDGSSRGWKREYDGPINIKWFGATGDGITDDTSAINSAIAAGYKIYLPSGTYLISSQLVADKTGFKFFGEGEGVTIIKADALFSDDYMLNLGNGTVSRYFNEIRNLSFDGNSVDSIIGIYLNRVNNQSKIIHNNFYGFGTNGTAVKAENLALANIISYNKFGIGTNTTDIHLVESAGNSWLIEGNYFASGGRVYIEGSMTDITIIGNTFDNGSYVYSSGVSGPRGVHILSNRFEGTPISSYGQIELGICRGVSIENNYFSGNNNATKAINLTSSGTGVSTAVISNNWFEGFTTSYVVSVLSNDKLELYGNRDDGSASTPYNTNTTLTTFENGGINVSAINTPTSKSLKFNNNVLFDFLDKLLTGGGSTDSVFKITTNGTKGSYTVIMDVHYSFVPTSTAVSAGYARYSWTHITDSGGISTTSAVSEDKILSVVSDAPATRDIDSASVVISKTSDSIDTIQITLGTTGSATSLVANIFITLIYDVYTSKPVIEVL